MLNFENAYSYSPILCIPHLIMMPCAVKVLAESDQLRKEADDLGPRAELDHWKKRMSRFNYLLDQLKSSDVKAVLGVLIVAKSKLIKVGGLLYSPFITVYLIPLKAQYVSFTTKQQPQPLFDDVMMLIDPTGLTNHVHKCIYIFYKCMIY